MIDTDKYTEDVDEAYNLIMNLMDDEEREFEIKARIRQSNDMKVAVDKLGAEVKRLQKKVKKLNWVLTDLDEKIQNYESHAELMKAFEQGLELPETWKEMVE